MAAYAAWVVPSADQPSRLYDGEQQESQLQVVRQQDYKSVQVCTLGVMGQL